MPVVEISEKSLEDGARLLRAGQLVAFPTETVYGLGADATSGTAVAALYAAKGRPRFNPLIAHVADFQTALKYVDVNGKAAKLAEVFWPGPLTLVLPRRPDSAISELVTAGLDTLAIRVPSHPIARDLLRRANVPVAAPSANMSGHVSPTTAAHVAADLRAKVAMILDGGPTEHGLESTVVAVDGKSVTILRPGALTAAQIEKVVGGHVGRSYDAGVQPRSPGQLESHYAPHAAVRMNATTIAAGEALLAFGPSPPVTVGPVINLSPRGDLVEAAANFFAALRTLDQPHINCIAVCHIPNAGLGEAINDRLERASKGR
jgi:L-threonylcarbamoyladenylate synthase